MFREIASATSACSASTSPISRSKTPDQRFVSRERNSMSWAVMRTRLTHGQSSGRDGDLAGRRMGRQIGNLVWRTAQGYFDGTEN
jgi:hypothetical protein